MTRMNKIFWLITIIGNSTCYYLATEVTSTAYYFLALFTTFSLIGFYDLLFSKHNLNKNYPVAAYIRYMLEFIRPEIHQYFVANNTEERPFSREERSIVYQRAKKVRDTIPFGTQRNIWDTGYLNILHSMSPKTVTADKSRTLIGGPDCTQPYSASLMNISAMSFGALSGNAIRALNIGAKLGSFYHNTGEGGISDHHRHGGDLVWQIGTGYFGCRSLDGKFCPYTFQQKASDEAIKMIEIKLSQGAKPSHGGILPAAKVTAEVAALRGVKEGVTCISPPAHCMFKTPEELLMFVKQLRELSSGKPIGFKLCLGIKSEFMGICKAMLSTGITPDFITVDGAEGGTGAAPIEFTNRLGTPVNEAIYFISNCLIGCNLKEKIKIIASGKTASSFHLLNKLALGADIVNAARTMMFALGCVQSLSCNTDHCPTGIATQNKSRAKAINVTDKSQRVYNYHHATVHNFLELIGAMGLSDPTELKPYHLSRRVENETTKHYDEIYQPLKAGELLTDNINVFYKEHWDRANAGAF